MTLRHLAFALLSLTACASSSGGEQSTPGILVVAVSTDLQIPGDLDVLDIVVDGPGGPSFSRTYAIPGEASLPGTIAIVTKTKSPDTKLGTISPGAVPLGGDGTYTVTLHAKHAATTIVTRSAKLDLVGSFSKKLSLSLDKACLATPPCGDGQTCIAGTCVPNAISLAALPAP